MALILRQVLLHGMAVNNLTSRGAINLEIVATALINDEHNTEESPSRLINKHTHANSESTPYARSQSSPLRAHQNPSVPLRDSFWREAFSPEIFCVQLTPRSFSAAFTKAQRITECIPELRRTSVFSFVP